jgi:hypothetical protein
MITTYTNQLFEANVVANPNQKKVEFNLTNNMDQFGTAGGGAFSCGVVKGLRSECLVQNYIFNNCY